VIWGTEDEIRVDFDRNRIEESHSATAIQALIREMIEHLRCRYLAV
jgi:hypothetical protein